LPLHIIQTMKTMRLKLLVTLHALLSLAPLATAAPERVVSVKQVPEIGATFVKFENNVLLNFKRTDFEKGRVHVNVSFGGGMLSLPQRLPGLNILAQGMFIFGGLEDRSFAEILKQLRESGAHGNLQFGMELHRNKMNGDCPSEHLEKFLELFTAYFTKPGFNADADDMARYRAFVATFGASAPASIMGNNIIADLANDKRISLTSYKDAASRTMGEVRQWLAPQLAKSAIEITIVGDISYDDALAAALKTFGALPARPECAPYKIDTSTKFVKKPGSTIIKTLDATSKQAAFAFVLPAPADATDAPAGYTNSMLAQVIKDNVEASLRKQLGATGTVLIFPWLGKTMPNTACFIVSDVVDPAVLDKAIAITRQSLAKLASEGVSENDFARIKNSLVENARQPPAQTNDYWISTLDDAQSKSEKLETLGVNPDLPKIYENITREKINALAARLINLNQAYLYKAAPRK